MDRWHSVQWVHNRAIKFSHWTVYLERINEIHESKDEESQMYQAKKIDFEKSIRIENIDFKYDPLFFI